MYVIMKNYFFAIYSLRDSYYILDITSRLTHEPPYDFVIIANVIDLVNNVCKSVYYFQNY